MIPEQDLSGPAFPVLNYIAGQSTGAYQGMSLRDYTAIKAMQSLILCPTPSPEVAAKYRGLTIGEYLSTKAYEIADEMMKARQV